MSEGIPESIRLAARAEFDRAKRRGDRRLQPWLDELDGDEAPSEATEKLDRTDNEKSRHETGSSETLGGDEGEPIEPAGQPQEGGGPQHGEDGDRR